MKTMVLRGALAGLVFASGIAAAAPTVAQEGMADLARDQVGTPLKSEDAAAQPWTLEHQGRALCVIRLDARAISHEVFRVEIPADCGGNLPAGVAAWRPVTDGAALIDSGGRVLVDFNRWSDSLLVADRASGFDVQLRRGR
jgi:hypothetical protein